MGLIISNIGEIENVRWTALTKGRVTKAVRVLAIDETQVIIELANGSYTVAGRRHTPNGKWAVMGYGLDRFTATVLDGLVRLGVLTREQVEHHKKRQQELSDKSARKYAKKSLEDACKTLGIPVPDTEAS